MSLEKELQSRSGNKCELCGSEENLAAYIVPPHTETLASKSIYACQTCSDQLQEKTEIDINHWRCLNDSMWSEEAAVQVVAYRMLHKLRAEGWPQDLLDMMYLDEETKAWAKEGLEEGEAIVHKDAFGNVLSNGDKVVITETLNVKGANLSAKKGTVVHNIRLVHDNAEQIEGKVDGQTIVILTKYLKKN
ncbi:MAG: PhnA domain-containing protein [Chitinophagales bacterium]|nr:PhnA domain-containing protein [Chitinophagales bacterium]